MTLDPLRSTFRRARRSPLFAATVVGILALAVGGTGALLSLVNAVVLRPLPVRSPDELVLVTPGRGEARFGFSGETLAELRRNQTAFEDVCGYTRTSLTVEIPGLPKSLRLEALSDNCDAVLGRQPFMGRMLDERDRGLDTGAPGVAVVSYEFWTRTLNRDPEVIGRVLATPRVPLTIVGVAGPGAAMDADTGADLIVTLGAVAHMGGRPSILVVDAIGRLRPGVTIAQADAAIRALWPTVWAAANRATSGPPAPASRADSLRIESFARGLSTLRYRYSEALRALLWLAALLLMLACLNVGGLLLARTLSREHELGVLTALGATPGRLLSQVASESFLLAAAAALLACPIAWVGSQALVSTVWVSQSALAMSVTPDGWVWASIALGALCAGLVASAPAAAFVWRYQTHSVAPASRTTTRRTTRGRMALIVVQVAVSVVLLFSAALFTRNLAGLRDLDPGYDPAPVRWSRIALQYGQPPNIDQVAYFRPLLEQVTALPQVVSVALSTPFPGTEPRHVVGRPPFSRPDVPGGPKVGGQVNWISPDFFSTLGVSLEQGREFLWSDDAKRPGVAVINRAVAGELFPQGDAVGRSIRIDDLGLDLSIVGVVGDVTPGDYRLTHLPRIYRPLAQDQRLMVTPLLIYRVNGDAGLTDQVRAVIDGLGRHSADPLQTIDTQTDIFFMRERVLAGIGIAFALMSTLIGGLGLYALMAYTATRRVREAGIRMALGASRLRVLRLLALDGGKLVAAGVVVGVPLALLAGGALRGLLNAVAPGDGTSLLMAVSLLLVTGACACLLPAAGVARRAVVAALRAE